MQNKNEIINKAIYLQKSGKLKEAEEYLQFHYSNSKDDTNISIAYASVSESTIRRAIVKGNLKSSKVTGRLLFKVSSVDRWLNG